MRCFVIDHTNHTDRITVFIFKKRFGSECFGVVERHFFYRNVIGVIDSGIDLLLKLFQLITRKWLLGCEIESEIVLIDQ